jgi:DNA-directed RNA polymerase subunit RPC12/RpoP
MLLKQKCTTCGKRVTETETVQCETCGEHLHASCEAFETKYECSTCGDEEWLGALEF